jgi:hypothetical protein
MWWEVRVLGGRSFWDVRVWGSDIVLGTADRVESDINKVIQKHSNVVELGTRLRMVRNDKVDSMFDSITVHTDTSGHSSLHH